MRSSPSWPGSSARAETSSWRNWCSRALDRTQLSQVTSTGLPDWPEPGKASPSCKSSGRPGSPRPRSFAGTAIHGAPTRTSRWPRFELGADLTNRWYAGTSAVLFGFRRPLRPGRLFGLRSLLSISRLLVPGRLLGRRRFFRLRRLFGLHRLLDPLRGFELHPEEALGAQPVVRAGADHNHEQALAGAASQHGSRPVRVVVEVLSADVTNGAAARAGAARGGHVVYEDLSQKPGAGVAVEPQLTLVHSCHPPVGA